MGISLISELEPKNSGSFALLDDKYLRGGLRVVETHNDLATIPTDRLKDGMLAMVTTPAKVLYIYNQQTNTWSPFSSGGEGGSVWSCVGDNETIKITQNIDDWTQTISAINNIRTYEDYSVLPTEDVADNEVAYCKADAVVGLTTYKRGFYYYELSSTSWVEVNSTIEIDSALSETSKRPVQNRVVTKALGEKVSKDDVDNVISKYSENPIQNKAVATALENVKAGKTMTAEEYGALDDETKNDGSFYYISDTGEIYQNGIIYGGKQTFDVTQEEYEALTDEEKAVNEYHCTDTGRVYINGILYGDKKPIELTFEEYKQLEADGKVEADVDYVIVSNESGVSSGFLLSDIDTNHGSSNVSTYEVIETLKSDVDKKAEILDSEKNDVNTWRSNKIASEITGVETELNAKLGELSKNIDLTSKVVISPNLTPEHHRVIRNNNVVMVTGRIKVDTALVKDDIIFSGLPKLQETSMYLDAALFDHIPDIASGYVRLNSDGSIVADNAIQPGLYRFSLCYITTD